MDALTAVEHHPAVSNATLRTLFLTQSFRFGPEIAFVANACLDVLKGVTSPPLIGGKRPDSITGTGVMRTAASQQSSRTAILGRTNARLFQVREELKQISKYC